MRSTAPHAIVSALVVLLAACASRGPSAERVSYTGRVSVGGTDAGTFTMLELDGGARVGVVGSLLAEIRALNGTRVMVEGVAATAPPGNAVDVTRYEVIEVNGERPYVGVLVQEGAGHALRQDNGAALALTGVSDALAANVGAKIWATGRMTDGRLQVQSFGVIRPRR